MSDSPALARSLGELQAHRSRGDKRATAMLCGVLLERLLKIRALAVLSQGTGAARDALQQALGDTAVERATLGDLLRGLGADPIVAKHRKALWQVRDARNWAAHDQGVEEPNALVIEGCAETIWDLVEALQLPEAALRQAAPPPPSGGGSRTLMVLGVGGLLLIIAAGVLLFPQARAPDAVDVVPVPKASAPLVAPPPTDSTAFAVVLYADTDTLPLPDPDDLSARRRFLGEQVLPALIAARPRAIALDYHFVGRADASSTEALGEALIAARQAGIPVLTVLPVGQPSEWPRCTGADPGAACVLDHLDARVSDEAVRSWSMCEGGRMTFGHGAALLATLEGPVDAEAWRGFWCPDEPVALRLPATEPCEAPWKRLWVSELITGQPFTGQDPVTLASNASCGATAADLADRVVFVGDPRRHASGQDVVRLGAAGDGPLRAFAGAEAHAVVAWNLLALLGDEHP